MGNGKYLSFPFNNSYSTFPINYGLSIKKMDSRTKTKRSPKDMRKLLRKDVELTVNDRILTLAEYNYFFNTDFSLEDIYGKEVVEEATKEKIKELENRQLLGITIEADLQEDEYKTAAQIFVVNFLYNDFSEFEKLLDDNVSLVIFKKKRIKGKRAVIDYWKDYRFRARQQIITDLEVRFYPYYSATGLSIGLMGYFPTYLLYTIANGKINNMVFYFLSQSEENREHDEIVETLPYTVEEARKHFVADAPAEAYRLPCFHCGKQSEELVWHLAKFNEYPDVLTKRISVCPDCHCVVESRVEKREKDVLDAEEPSGGKTFEEINISTEAATNTELDEFANIGNKFRTEVNRVANNPVKNKDAMLAFLPELHLHDGCHIGFANEDDEIHGPLWFFYVIDPKTGMDQQVCKFTNVNPSKMGVWQFYLLCNAEAFIGHNALLPWMRPLRFIFDRSDLECLPGLKRRDIRRLESCGYLFPTISIEKVEGDSEKYIGKVACSYWESDTLWREYRQYEIDGKGRVTWLRYPSSDAFDYSHFILHREPRPIIYD